MDETSDYTDRLEETRLLIAPQVTTCKRRLLRSRSLWVVGAIAALLVAVISAGIALNGSTKAPTPRPGNAGDPFTAALAKLDTLSIKGRAPKTGYSREAFGPPWTDDVNVEGGHNGCDTRNDILRRDLIDITIKPGSHGCTVWSGTLINPYSGRTIPFTRGATTSTAVQIDHVVPLADAWQKGAQQLNQQTRQDLANDPRNLQATDGATNEQKGDGDAATWLPPNKAYRCTYVSRQVEVKALYGLWVTQAEHDAIANLLVGCGDTAPAATDDPAPTLAPEPAPPLASSTTPIPYPGSAPGGVVVHPGSFCTPPGATGVSSTGKPMVCGPASDGKHRWAAG